MFLITKLLQAAREWRPRRTGPKPPNGHAVAVEQLDHRQLLSVNFTGNVATDFPATTSPGRRDLQFLQHTRHPAPIIPPDLQSLIPVSGYDLSEIRVSYDAADDTFSVGLNQPPRQSRQPVLGAGDRR